MDLRLASMACRLYLLMGLLGTFASLASSLTFETLRGRSTSRELSARTLTPTDVCKRWSQQSALVNGTIYLYGGRATTDESQTSHEWNNDFLSLDVTKTWQISGPSLTGLPRPSGPPSVANGYLWYSYDSLYLYGGEFSDNPITSPVPFSLWEYQISSGRWLEHTDPTTSQGDNAPADGKQVLRAAEGAGFSVAALGRGWYFGGHEDQYTINGWTYKNGRVYLTSLLEYTFPGYSNSEVKSLSSGDVANAGGVWRNITKGTIDQDAGFPERADGVLVWVPGFGKEGILLGLAGGNSDTFTQTNIIDVYDVGSSSWYKQATSGPMPRPRVNPCAVVAAAADGSSYNVYMYGGQNLLPAGHQTQYSDIWILSLPTFTWIPVNTSGQSVPPGRSGHTCNVWDAQMIVVGGYVGTQLSCDAGTYVFDMSALQWVNQFTPASNLQRNPQNKQIIQIDDPFALQGSFGYRVPTAVQAVIGGSPSGGATATTPSATATAGPVATGKPKRYHLAPGAKASGSGNAGGSSSSNSSNESDSSGSSTNVGAIVAAVIASLLFIVLCYLLFVTWLYRKRLREYKRNVDTLGRRPAEDKEATTEYSNSTPRGRSTSRRPAKDTDDATGEGYGEVRDRSADSLAGREPTFVGIMLSPRRSLRITNPD